ncbi:response regulator [Rubellimicrobium roseum]|uniref:Response regulator n=1 Tax=Rubellimicrobium roseum TaxID=687525 RepID=A0A5C4NBP1_9RHOB|nr:response regulator [Rubellimicrobium roseum]TNC63122.1 response regulator [Rubellimicrobium roseum]
MWQAVGEDPLAQERRAFDPQGGSERFDRLERDHGTLGRRQDASGHLLRNSPLLLQGRRILVVEDDYMQAEDLHRGLESLGAEVLGPAATVAEALAFFRTGPMPDAAILDTQLEDETVFPVADALHGRSIPFCLLSSHDTWATPDAYADVPCAGKPVDLRWLGRVLTW